MAKMNNIIKTIILMKSITIMIKIIRINVIKTIIAILDHCDTYFAGKQYHASAKEEALMLKPLWFFWNTTRSFKNHDCHHHDYQCFLFLSSLSLSYGNSWTQQGAKLHHDSWLFHRHQTQSHDYYLNDNHHKHDYSCGKHPINRPQTPPWHDHDDNYQHHD